MASTLHIHVDTSLSSSFDDLATTTRDSAVHGEEPLYKHTKVRACRSCNPAAQTLLVCSPLLQGGEGAVAKTVDPLGMGEEIGTVDVFLFMEPAQASGFLQKAARGEGAWECYLEALCKATVTHVWPCTTKSEGKENVAECRYLSLPYEETPHRHLLLHIVVAPRVIISMESSAMLCLSAVQLGQQGFPSQAYGECNIRSKDIADLFSAALLWLTPYCELTSDESTENATRSPNGTGDTCTAWRRHASVGLGLCTTAANSKQAAYMVLPVVYKHLKSMSEATAAALRQPREGAQGMCPRLDLSCETLGSPTLPSSSDTTLFQDIRPDTQRKCDPHDFQKLYATMLSEVSSYSNRKTLAAMSAFPTLHHLLTFLDRSAAATHVQQKETYPKGNRAMEATISFPNDVDSQTCTNALPHVYCANYGESRCWNVLDDAIIDALMTDYRPQRMHSL